MTGFHFKINPLAMVTCFSAPLAALNLPLVIHWVSATFESDDHDCAMNMKITFLWQFLWSWPWLKKEYEIVIYDVRSVLCSFRKMTIIVKVNALWVDCCLLASDIFMLKYSTDAAPSPVFTLWEWKQDFQWKCCTEVENILWKMYFLICYFSRLLKQRIPTRFYDSSKVTLQSVFPIERHWL